MDKITKIWIILSLLTLFAFVIGWFKLTSLILISVLLVTTFIKGQLVIDYFMDLKEVSLKYRALPALWLLLVTSFVGIAYYFPVNN